MTIDARPQRRVCQRRNCARCAARSIDHDPCSEDLATAIAHLANIGAARRSVLAQHHLQLVERLPTGNCTVEAIAARPCETLARLRLRDEIAIPFAKATLVIEFPLTHPAHVAINAALPQGFTLGELVQTICDEYAHVYAAEEGTASADVEIEHRAGQPERMRSDGAYGIWGHPLEHLVLRSARWVKQSNGDVIVDLHVDAKPLPSPHPPPELVE